MNNFICGNCGTLENIELHHVVPRSLGGTDKITNIVPLCSTCHGKVHSVDFNNRNISELTKIGIEKARANGKQIGGQVGRKLVVKKAQPTKEKIRKLSKSFEGTLSDKEVMELLKVARNTYYKYKKEMKDMP